MTNGPDSFKGRVPSVVLSEVDKWGRGDLSTRTFWCLPYFVLVSQKSLKRSIVYQAELQDRWNTIYLVAQTVILAQALSLVWTDKTKEFYSLVLIQGRANWLVYRPLIFPVDKKRRENCKYKCEMAGYAERVQRKSRGEVKKIKLVGHSLSVTLSYIILIIIGIKGVVFLCIQYIIAAPLLWQVYKTKLQKGISQVIPVVNNLLANAGDIRDTGSIPESGRSPGGRHDNLLQYSYLENPMGWGAWWATAHGVQRVGHKWRDLTCMLTKFRKVRETVCQ